MIDDTVASLMAIGFTALLLSALTSLGWLQAPIDLQRDAASVRGVIREQVTQATEGLGSAGLDITVTPPPLPRLPRANVVVDANGNTVSVTQQPGDTQVVNQRVGLAHPLLDMIYAPDRQEAIAPAVLSRELASADVVLIGETHDNPDHHNLQAWIIRELVRKGRKPAVALEMIGADQQPQLAAYVGKPGAKPEGLGAALGWNQHWPDWSIYVPIAKAVMDNNLTIVPADADAERIEQVSRQGLRALTDPERTRLGLGTPLGTPQMAALLDEIRTAHCNLLPPGEVEPMSQVQRFRDASMADNLITAAARAKGGTVLITGGGHVRNDRAVPYYISQRAPQLRTLSVLLIEVDDKVKDPMALVPKDAAGRPAVDYVWFTTRINRGDSCVEMRNALNKRNSGG
jgi:uncharacterized iron-regulated protein